MGEVSVIDVRTDILAENALEASAVRERLRLEGTTLINVTASPGAGKTTLILETFRRLRDRLRIGVIEGDVASQVDADRMAAAGIPAVQVTTGGLCHLDVPMVAAALDRLGPGPFDLVFVENIGNLVCTADFDLGADADVVLLSVPEGDDKPQKYPLIFATSDGLVVTKTDYLAVSDFDLEAATAGARALNPTLPVFPVSCRDGTGLDAWCAWVVGRVQARRQGDDHG
jgi:hydrogenase nickel incorporation protein HypB